MPEFPRYAIYYAAAADSALSRFGAELLGYDAHTGTELPFPAEATTLAADWHALTADPRKYGFHATLKAPMALASGQTEAGLSAACAAFAAQPRLLPRIRPEVQSISGFIAVVPAEPVGELQQLAADCVRAFDRFRAPLTPDNRERRQPAKLSERQRSYLDRWGYPYVFEEFRFHMTLTGRLVPDQRDLVMPMLRRRFDELALDRIAIDRIALFKQDSAASRFRVVGEWPLSD